MWEIAVSLQVQAFFAAVIFGALLCLVYDLLRASRLTGADGFAAVLAGDLVYSLLAAVLTFLFLLVFTGGQVRFYALAGLASGFALCRVTLSRLWLRFAVWLFSLVRRLAGLFSRVRARFWGVFCLGIDKIVLFWKKICKKLRKTKKNS